MCWLCATPLLGFMPFASVLFPPLGLYALKLHAALLPFLAVPGALAASATFVLVRGVRPHLRSAFVRALLANAVFLAVFVAGAEAGRTWWIARAAQAIHAQCHWSRPFVASVALRSERGDYAPAHAMAFAGGRYLIWSYSERRFVPDERNFGDRGCAGLPGA